MVFAQTLFTRAVDPVIPKIAADLAVDIKTAALLTTAFAFPYALIQPLLGTTADFFNKAKLINLCAVVVSVSILACAMVSSFSLLLVFRIIAGVMAGGVFPVAMALVGDMVPIHQRQVAIARLLGVAVTANVLGATVAGIIGDVFGWRGVFGILGALSLATSILGLFALRNLPAAAPARFNRHAVIANFRGILADPRAKICFAAVFAEGVILHGLFPYVGLLLAGIGETRASIAGLLLACFAGGGVIYAMLVPYLVRKVPSDMLMFAGGAISSSALALVALQFPWQAQLPIFAIVGLGFYLLHSCIQVQVTDLSQTARGAATSLHSASFFLGQAMGPVVYGTGFAYGGTMPTILTGAMVLFGVGIACARLLRRRAQE